MKGFWVACVVETFVWLYFRKDFLYGETPLLLKLLALYGAGFIASVLVLYHDSHSFDPDNHEELAALLLVPGLAAWPAALLSFVL